MPTIDEQLLERMEQANRSLDALRLELRSKIRRRDILTTCAIVAAVIGLVVGFAGWRAQRDADADTKSSRIAGCIQYNRQQTEAITASSAHDLVLAAILVPEPRTPVQDGAVLTALSQLHDADVSGHRLRDCSPAGIRAYLSPPGTTTSSTSTTVP